MRTDELRSVLHQHADEVADGGIHDRITSVHDRVGAARRRRRAGAAIAAVAAVAAVALSVVPTSSTSPAPQPSGNTPPPRLAGWKLPATERVGMISYRYAQSVTSTLGARTLNLVLDSSDKVRALTWASSDSTWGTSVLRVDGRTVGRQEGGMLSSGQLLAPGREHQVTLTLRKSEPGDRLGLAVYEQSGRPPAGVTNRMTTFRQTIAADHLLGATIGGPGQQSIAFDVTVPSLRLRLSDTCYGVSVPSAADVRVDGHLIGGPRCEGSAEPDPGPSGMLFTATDRNLRAWGIEPGDTVHITMDLRRADDAGGQPLQDPDAVLGVGLYELGPSAGIVAGWDVPRFTEHGNAHRLAEYVRSVESKPGDREVTLTLEAADTPRLVSMTMSRITGGPVQIFVDGKPTSVMFSAGSGSGGWVRIAPGKPHTVRLVHTRGDSPRGLLGLVVSRIVD